MSTTALIVIAVVWLSGAVVSLVMVRRIKQRRRDAGEEVPKSNPGLALAIVAIIALALGFAFGPGLLAEKRHEELMATGTKTIATITAVEETGNVFNGSPEVRVRVKVETPEGGSFDSQETWVFSIFDVQTYRVGTKVDAFFDPADTESVAIVGVHGESEASVGAASENGTGDGAG